jgi:maltose 6'-phosphate phosphatase
LVRRDARYVSTSRDPYDIHARKVVMVQIDAPDVGRVNVFSAHLSWWSDGFRVQWDALAAWAKQQAAAGVAATLLCGDFNVEAGGEGYRHAMQSSDFEDQVLRATSPELFEAVFRSRQADRAALLRDDHRIDFVWLERGSALEVVHARAVFTDDDYGRVSDHLGYVAAFERK